jgi:hypothetical protein
MSVSQEEKQVAAQQIAEALGETEAQPRRQIQDIVALCGIEFAQSILQATLEIEANGGLMLADNSRRRTPGGVFFYLARGKMEKDIARRIFPQYFKAKAKTDKPPQPVLPPFVWDERLELLKPLLDQRGVLNTVKVTLIGRPGQVDTSRRDLVVTTLNYVPKSATLPKGLPPLPDKPTLYTVYIAAKQWRKVADAIRTPDDALIIEGTCVYDEAVGGMAVFAMSVTTKALEAKKRQQQKDAAAQSSQAATPPPVEVSPEPPPAPAAPLPNLPNAPADALQKLSELYASASLFRQKIATIQAKPAGQQSGLEMTQKLLKNVENEIAALEKKYAG